MNKKINKNSKINDTGKMKIGWWDIFNYDYRNHYCKCDKDMLHTVGLTDFINDIFYTDN